MYGEVMGVKYGIIVDYTELWEKRIFVFLGISLGKGIFSAISGISNTFLRWEDPVQLGEKGEG